MAVKIDLDVIAIKRDANLVALRQVRSTTRRVLNRSAVLCPVDTGRLRASGRMRIREGARGPRGIVEYTVKYAAAVHDGTGPRIIRPRKKKALAFEYKGQQVVVKSVVHRGSRGRPFLTAAAREVAAGEGMTYKRLR